LRPGVDGLRERVVGLLQGGQQARVDGWVEAGAVQAFKVEGGGGPLPGAFFVIGFLRVPELGGTSVPGADHFCRLNLRKDESEVTIAITHSGVRAKNLFFSPPGEDAPVRPETNGQDRTGRHVNVEATTRKVLAVNSPVVRREGHAG